MVFLTRLGPGGHELARFADAFNAAPARDDRYPEHAQWVPQYRLERVLLDKVRTLPSVEVRFETSLLTATQDADGITATLSSDGEVRARYLIGTDGGRSAVRELIGAKLEWRHGLSHRYNIIFRAPGMAEAHGHGPASIHWQIGRDGFSAVAPMDAGDLWTFNPGGAKPGVSLSPEDAAALIAGRTGIDLPVEGMSADTWTASELLADSYGRGRIFPAGDAAHLHPPAGGYGMNMGVGDGVDLGWKLATVLHGWGGPALLASYEAERRPVARAVIDEAMANYAIYVAPPPPEIEDDGPAGEAIRAKVGAGIQASKAREFATLGTVLGLCYTGSPVIADEGTPMPQHDSQHYTLRPPRLPRAARLAGGRTLALRPLRPGLLAGRGRRRRPGRDRERRGAGGGARRAVPVVRSAGVDVAALYGAALALVRPDQHVAWRGDRWTDALALATGRA